VHRLKSVIFSSSKHKAAIEAAKCCVSTQIKSFHDVPADQYQCVVSSVINALSISSSIDISSGNDELSSVYTPLFFELT